MIRVTFSGIHGLFWKAMTNVSRYSASGTTQRKGAEATSVDRWAVTPSIKLEGAAARRTRMALSRQLISALRARGAGSVERSSRRLQTTAASAMTIIMKTA